MIRYALTNTASSPGWHEHRVFSLNGGITPQRHFFLPLSWTVLPGFMRWENKRLPWIPMMCSYSPCFSAWRSSDNKLLRWDLIRAARSSEALCHSAKDKVYLHTSGEVEILIRCFQVGLYDSVNTFSAQCLHILLVSETQCYWNSKKEFFFAECVHSHFDWDWCCFWSYLQVVFPREYISKCPSEKVVA